MNNSTVNNILCEAKQLLSSGGIESYALDSQLLVAHALGKSREFLIGHRDYQLSISELEEYNRLIKRRLDREPISHILGMREFWTMEFKVNKYTLDPRPDSETLIECALSIFPDRKHNLKILDLGTGTGCLPLTLLSEYKNANALAVDLSDQALEVAQHNAKNLKLNDRINFLQSNWLENVEGKFDLIISNPPYISPDDIQTLEDEVRIHEPNLALDGGEDGLECYRDIAKNIDKACKENTVMILEIGKSQENDIKKIFHHYKLLQEKKDLAGIVRCLAFQVI